MERYRVTIDASKLAGSEEGLSEFCREKLEALGFEDIDVTVLPEEIVDNEGRG